MSLEILSGSANIPLAENVATTLGVHLCSEFCNVFRTVNYT